MDDQLKLSLPRRLLSYLICSLIAFSHCCLPFLRR